MPGWRFSAILATSPLHSTSSFWTTVMRIVQLSAVLTGTSLFSPTAFFPGCGHEISPVFLSQPIRLNGSLRSPQISHVSSFLRWARREFRIDRVRCLLTLLLTQIIPTKASFIFIYDKLYGYLRNNPDTFLGNAIHKVEKNTTFF